MSEKEPSNAARKFSCPDCHAEIVIKYLNPGDTALCRRCGSEVTVPSELIETEEAPSFATQERPEPVAGGKSVEKRPWNPRWLAFFGFFFSYAAAGFLWALNFKRLGEPEKSRSAWLQLVFFVIAAYFVSDYIQGQDWPWLAKVIVGELVNFPLLFYMTYTQLERFKRYREDGGKGASYVKPIFVTIGTYLGIALTLTLVVYAVAKHEVTSFLEHNAKLAAEERIVQSLLLRGDTDSARAYVDYMEERYPYYRDGDYHRSYCFFFAHQYDSSVAYAERYRDARPDDPQAKALFHMARAYQRYQKGRLEDALVDITIYLEANPADEAEFLFRRRLLREIDEK